MPLFQDKPATRHKFNENRSKSFSSNPRNVTKKVTRFAYILYQK